jgi:hypothetical protein
MAERFDISRDGTTLAGERWPGGARTVLLLLRASRTGGDGPRWQRCWHLS